MQIRRITLRTADGLNPTPMAMSWVRDGVLMCGMDNEITIYSQWREDSTVAAAACTSTSGADGGRSIADHRSLQESDLLSIAQVYPHTKTKVCPCCLPKLGEYGDILLPKTSRNPSCEMYAATHLSPT